MDRKETLNYIEKQINEGVPKPVIYKELIGKVQYKTDLLSYLAQCPSLKLKTKYKKLNLMLWFTLFIILILYGITSFNIFTNFKSEFIPWLILRGFGTHILMPAFILYSLFQLHKYRAQLYRFIIIFGVLVVGTSSQYNTLPQWLLYAGPWILAMSLSYIIRKKVFPYDRLFKGLDTKMLESEFLQ